MTHEYTFKNEAGDGITGNTTGIRITHAAMMTFAYWRKEGYYPEEIRAIAEILKAVAHAESTI